MKKDFALTVQMDIYSIFMKEEEFAVRHHRGEAGVMVWGAISSKGVVHLEIRPCCSPYCTFDQ
jgi:hypothetical protein